MNLETETLDFVVILSPRHVSDEAFRHRLTPFSHLFFPITAAGGKIPTNTHR